MICHCVRLREQSKRPKRFHVLINQFDDRLLL